MKQTPLMQQIQEKMKPGIITLHGFLGDDSRNLVDILVDDEAEVRRLGLTHRRIAERMSELRQCGEQGLGYFLSVAPHFEVKVDSVRGKLSCPFGHPGMFQKRNTTVRNVKMEREITYTDLNIHLIDEHGFYEGEESPFRLDPRELATIIGVE